MARNSVPASRRTETLRKPAARGTQARQGVVEDDRYRQAVDAAEHVFMSNGFHTSTMTDVAQYAGMSKKTIYRVFDSKEDLLDAVLSRRLATLTRPAPEDDGRPIPEVLTDLLLQTIAFVVLPKEIAFLRLMISDTVRAEPIVRAIIRQGVFNGRTTLATWLARQAASGGLPLDEPSMAAEMLIGLALGDLLVRLLLNASPTPGAAAVRRRVSRAVDIFLNGVSQGAVP